MEIQHTKITVTELTHHLMDYIIVTFKADGLDLSKTKEGEHKLTLRKENVFNYRNMKLPAECILDHDTYFLLQNTYIRPI